MIDPTLEALTTLIADVARKAADDAVHAKLSAADGLHAAAMGALDKAGAMQAKLEAALALADTLNVVSEQRIVATADVVITTMVSLSGWEGSGHQASVRDVLNQISGNNNGRAVPVNRLGKYEDIPPANYGVVICLYRRGPRE